MFLPYMRKFMLENFFFNLSIFIFFFINKNKIEKTKGNEMITAQD